MAQSSLAERFWSKTAWKGECLEWTGVRRVNGYGEIKVDGHRVAAHRVAWQLANGPIPDGMFVCHHCDNPPCVRLDHLFLGTPKDNTADMVRKGRARGPKELPSQRGDLHYSRRKPELVRRGFDCPASKFSPEQVGEIRALVAAGMPQKAVSERLGISRASVCRIVNRKVYADVA